MELQKRKMPRHPNYNYSTPGYYFITLCTKGKSKILGQIVGRGIPDAPLPVAPLPCSERPGGRSLHMDAPHMVYSEYGKIAKNQLEYMSGFYANVILEKYVIMPNHIHMLIQIPGCFMVNGEDTGRENNLISQYVGTFKRFCNKQFGHNVWQTSFHDHVIRGEKDYLKIWEYIDNNPQKWTLDCFYIE